MHPGRRAQQRLVTGLGVLLLTAAITACGGSGGSSTAGKSDQTLVRMGGDGSLLIGPLLTEWGYAYAEQDGLRVTYEPRPYRHEVVPVAKGESEYAFIDSPITTNEFRETELGIAMIPCALTGIAIVYHLDGYSKPLNLSPEVLTKIVLGKIKNWDDPEIAKLNSGGRLPSVPIVPVYRADENADDYGFTNSMSAASPLFLRKLGVFSRRVEFPVGVSATGSDGVAHHVSRIDGAIGYTNLPYATEHRLNMARIENRAGRFVKPTPQALTAGAETDVRLGPNFEVWARSSPPKNKASYPLLAFTYAVVPVESRPQSAQLKKFLEYVLEPTSQADASAHGYAPLPETFVAKAKRGLAAIGSY